MIWAQKNQFKKGKNMPFTFLGEPHLIQTVEQTDFRTPDPIALFFLHCRNLSLPVKGLFTLLHRSPYGVLFGASWCEPAKHGPAVIRIFVQRRIEESPEVHVLCRSYDQYDATGCAWDETTRRPASNQVRLNETVELPCLMRLSGCANGIPIGRWQFFTVDHVTYCVGQKIQQFTGLN
jgi:hypothetical protein